MQYPAPQLKVHCIARGAATEKSVRKAFRLDGLLPSRRVALKREAERAKLWIERLGSPLEKYQALMTLKETNRDCFFAVLSQNLREYLPIVYTPTGATPMSNPMPMDIHVGSRRSCCLLQTALAFHGM